MFIAPLPSFLARQRRNGLSASFSAVLAHDAPAGVLGFLRVFGAKGPVSLVAGAVSGAAGDQGGLFSVSPSGGRLEIAFDGDGLGDAVTPGGRLTTRFSFAITDGDSVADARIVVTLEGPLAPPALISPIPDQTGVISMAAPILINEVPDQMDVIQ